MTAFLFARALHKTEELYLASNINSPGTFDGLVFRCSLRGPDVWKTCFVQFRHKKNVDRIKFSCLIKMSGDFSLFKYFESYSHIKSQASA